MEAWFESVLALLALPKFGLSTLFVVSFVSATLLPMGSEPAVFGLVSFPSTAAWTLFGTMLRRFLTDPSRLKLFNWTMAALLVASLWPMIAE